MQKTIKKLDDFLVLENYSQATRKSYVDAARNFYKWCMQHINDPDFDKPNAHRMYLIERSKKDLPGKRSMVIILRSGCCIQKYLVGNGV